MGTIGTAPEYEVLIEVSATPGRTLGLMPWGQINWQRTRNEPSKASVVIPGLDSGIEGQYKSGIESTAIFGGLRTWDHMLVIERNGTRVWDGPITGWAAQDDEGTVRIDAIDRSSILDRTLVGVSRTWKGGSTPLDVIIRAILADAGLDDPRYAKPWPLNQGTASEFANWDVAFLPPPPGDVELHVERLDTLATVFQQIGETTDFFYTQRCAALEFREYVARGELSPYGALQRRAPGYDGDHWPVLNEKTVLGLPKVTVDGSKMATDLYLGGASQGPNGHAFVSVVNLNSAEWYLAAGPPPRYLTSRLARGVANLSQTDDESLSNAAEQLAVEAATPNVTIEQMRLSPDFGGTALNPNLQNLRPGARFLVAFDDTVAFNVPVSKRVWVDGDFALVWSGYIQHARLEQLDVVVTPDEEQVLASCSSAVQVSATPVSFTDIDGVFRTLAPVL